MKLFPYFTFFLCLGITPALAVPLNATESSLYTHALALRDPNPDAASALDTASKVTGIVNQVFDGMSKFGEALGPEVEAVVAVVKFAAMFLEKIFGAIAKELHEDAAKRGAFTQAVVDGTLKAHPGWNVVIVHTKHDKKFPGDQGKDWATEAKTIGLHFGKMSYTIYTFRKGDFILLGDGGYINWAYGGQVISDDHHKDGVPRHVLFAADPNAKGTAQQALMTKDQLNKADKAATKASKSDSSGGSNQGGGSKLAKVAKGVAKVAAKGKK